MSDFEIGDIVEIIDDLNSAHKYGIVRNVNQLDVQVICYVDNMLYNTYIGKSVIKKTNTTIKDSLACVLYLTEEQIDRFHGKINTNSIFWSGQ